MSNKATIIDTCLRIILLSYRKINLSERNKVVDLEHELLLVHCL